MRCVVVTGLGGVTSIGHSLDEIWTNLKEGNSNVVELEGFKESGLNTWIGAPPKEDWEEEAVGREFDYRIGLR